MQVNLFLTINSDAEESQIIVKYSNNNDYLTENMNVKIQGVIMEDFSLESKSIFPLEDDFDFITLQQMTKIIHHEQFKYLFY